MDNASIKVLLIEDNPGDAVLVEHMLTQASTPPMEVSWASNLTAGIELLNERSADLVLLDLGLPESIGLDTVKNLYSKVSSIPAVVVMSALADENVALQAVQYGAEDYLIKREVSSTVLVRSIRYALERSQVKNALQHAKHELEHRVSERTMQLAKVIEEFQEGIVHRQQAERRISYMAHYDALTGLPNRVLLRDRIAQAIGQAQCGNTRVAIVFIDLDNFKHINDSLGHQIGDRLLQAVAGRIRQHLRDGDSGARLGGDEFVLILPLADESDDAGAIAQMALHALAQPFSVDGHLLHVGASIGISTYPDDGHDADTLMRAADAAMYHAKGRGRGNVQFFTPALNQAAHQRLSIENRLRNALAKHEFVLHYQPQVDIESGAIFSAEALLRWRQPGKEPVSCEAFIACAEDTGLILPLGGWVLRQACRQLKAWRNEGHADLRVSVNLSPLQICQPGFAATIAGILRETGLPANALDLEITERTMMQRNELTLATLISLSTMGVQLSVDDFGTGYSSLSYLQRFPVHAIKIDRSFVRGIGHDLNNTTLVTAIIAMANSLRLKVLAEGVETAEQAAFLLAHGCPSAQGYLYSAALSPGYFSRLLIRS
ncbi:MAG TPA: EAL domain-containing protein [Noviherbaspirillum sp.]|uniref:EAL domain-containing response regulator n=1 Tax=Noviherbaspirillum sp. TaxID=1926288 RepID=UPI002DDCC4F2|nr:EAL domain-containing protein [Noviherbaspirillum sp.]HEV2610402.1 EAL domain-containing protein [Noviherbaspirillum sp.]